jgi:YbgC/YbaW family acyl-CoA thioester hydrolase
VQAAEFNSIVGVLPAEVQWGDCDAAGIIFYPTYFRWFDSATWALFGSVGHGVKAMIQAGRVMPVVAAQCDFVTPAEPGDRCEVRSRITRWGAKSFVVSHEGRARRRYDARTRQRDPRLGSPRRGTGLADEGSADRRGREGIVSRFLRCA